MAAGRNEWLSILTPFRLWWPRVNKNSFRIDFIAGLTGAVVVLPQGVAFATIAGMPPEYGLYAGMIPAVVAALFGSSWHLVSGPTTAASIVVFSALSVYAEPASMDYVTLALTLTFMVGVIELALGLARMGALVNFISHSVIVGFTTGAALLIVLMLVMNGLVGLCLIVGGLRHRNQIYNLQGANAYLAVLLPLAILGLVLPRYTTSAPAGELSALQTGFQIALSIILYLIFLAVQTVTHSDIFRQPRDPEQGGVKAEVSGHQHQYVIKTVPYHIIGLIAALLPIVLLSKKLALYVSFGIAATGAPLALGGFLVAALILSPEALSAMHAARDNLLQRSVNISLGSALATIGLTIPAVLIIGWVTGEHIVLGLGTTDVVLLTLTLAVSLVTFISPRTNFLQGAVHLALFTAYVVMIFDGID